MPEPLRQPAHFTSPAPIPAWLLSAVFHAVAIVVLALVLKNPAPGVPQTNERPAAVALVQAKSNKTTYFTEDSFAEASAATTKTATNAGGSVSPLPTESEIEQGVAGILPTGEPDTLGPETGDLPGSSDLLNNGTSQKSNGQQTKTRVFGLPGVGSKFVYVFDRSASMSGFGGRPLKAAKRELIGSLAPMTSTNQFQIIFYNDKPLAVSEGGKKPVMMWGADRQKQVARQFVAGIAAAGNTNHLPALQLALGLHPDVVYFLTDAEEPQLSAQELRKIKEWNGAESVINTIEFGAGPASADHNFLKEITRQNRGQYIYVDVTTLSD